jgi:hypothetical protein
MYERSQLIIFDYRTWSCLMACHISLLRLLSFSCMSMWRAFILLMNMSFMLHFKNYINAMLEIFILWSKWKSERKGNNHQCKHILGSFQKLQKGIENKNMSNFSPTTVTEIISGHRLDIELWLMGHLFFRTSWNQFWRDKSGPKEWRPFFSMINIIISYGYFPKKTKHRYVWTCYLLVSLPLFAEYRFFSDR